MERTSEELSSLSLEESAERTRLERTGLERTGSEATRVALDRASGESIRRIVLIHLLYHTAKFSHVDCSTPEALDELVRQCMSRIAAGATT